MTNDKVQKDEQEKLDDTVSLSSVDSYEPQQSAAMVPEKERYDNQIFGENTKDLAVTILVDRG